MCCFRVLCFVEECASSAELGVRFSLSVISYNILIYSLHTHIIIICSPLK